jgi:hypothetical protein
MKTSGTRVLGSRDLPRVRWNLLGLPDLLLALLAVGCSAESSATPKAEQTAMAGASVTLQAGAGADSPAGPLTVAPAVGADACAAALPFKPAGCPCQTGQTAACWTGPLGMRHVGACHDGTQSCAGDAEFSTWQACVGEELNCGAPPPPSPPPPPPTTTDPPPPSTDCSCVPGAVIQCDEDCAALLFCSLTAQKTCGPDGTWGPCREGGVGNVVGVLAPDGGVAGLLGAAASIVQPLDDAGVPLNGTGPCRSMFHGCGELGVLNEVFTGDCRQQFKCGHAPPRD